MSRVVSTALFGALLAVTLGSVAQTPAAPMLLMARGTSSGGGEAAQALAFPTCEGFGCTTDGGRLGVVVRVTNLNDSGAGSLRAALTMTQPRIIVFATSGVIDLNSAITLTDDMGDVTVLGQTSPGGITIIGGELLYYSPDHGNADLADAVFRYLRFRRQSSHGGDDVVSFNGCGNVIWDHVDFSGGADETFDHTNCHDVDVQWSTYSNSLNEGGNANYGMLIAYRPNTGITLHHNLSANHNRRCGFETHWAGSGSPDVVPATGARLDIRNNVIHNCVFENVYRFDLPPDPEGIDINFVGNYGKVGPDSEGDPRLVGGDTTGDAYVSGNTYEGGSVNITSDSGEHDFPDVTTTSAAQAYTDVLACAGSWPRDDMNTRTVAEVMAGTGSLGDVSDDLDDDAPAVPTDTDEDGLPDADEATYGGNSAVADSMTLRPSGYTRIEEYANDLAAAYMAACSA